MKKSDNRIKVIAQENSGVSRARNIGIKKAVGKYISFVDVDDSVTEDIFEKLIKKADETSAEIVKCGFRYFDINQNMATESRCFELDGKNIYDKIYIQQNIIPKILGLNYKDMNLWLT